MIDINSGGLGSGSIEIVSSEFMKKAIKFAERNDFQKRFDYLLEEEEAAFFLYPQLLSLFKEVVRRNEVNRFLYNLTNTDRELIVAIYGPDRLCSNDGVCEKFGISNIQRKKHIAKIRYEMKKFLANL
ncbi:hypothetical protein [Listeria booriae]|uniref:Uncharacterized protein n=1 Tax=Listeria booriae TaxID=1552123 RepID=A0A7X1A9B2_9LIST|nr:hypothetical protein [Listeria booriae]MBC1333490.1 hypothetical protein [Listeria booriae]MBC2373657.1 hypothetical protein [Listeria booriae]MBC2388914.1 hypothetical protein [Listeria booriae]